MKKLTILLLCSLSLLAFTGEKQYAVQQTLPEWQKHLQKLEVIRQIADESNLPNQQVKFITRTIDSLEMVIVPQLQGQLKDSTKKK